jgi:predicted transcriptional regulator
LTLKAYAGGLHTGQEAQLPQIGSRIGKDAAQVVKDAASRMLQDQASFVEAVEKGLAANDRGKLIDHDEVVERTEGLFPVLTRLRTTHDVAVWLASVKLSCGGCPPRANSVARCRGVLLD